MADISDVTQPDQTTAPLSDSAAPVPPPPPIEPPPTPPMPPTSSDSLIVAAPGTEEEIPAPSELKPENTTSTETPVAPAAEETTPPKKKGMSTTMKITAVILLLVTFPLAGIAIKMSTDLRSQARECISADCSVTQTPKGTVLYDRSKDTSTRDKSGLSESQKEAQSLGSNSPGVNTPVKPPDTVPASTLPPGPAPTLPTLNKQCGGLLFGGCGDGTVCGSNYSCVAKTCNGTAGECGAAGVCGSGGVCVAKPAPTLATVPTSPPTNPTAPPGAPTDAPVGPSGTKYDVSLGQPPGSYPVYCDSSGCGSTVKGYRYIQAAGVFEGAIQRATGTYAPYGGAPQPISQQDLELLRTQYHLSGDNLKKAAEEVAAGHTWVPPGVGCNMSSSAESQAACTDWHWTTCLNKGTGVNGIGCDVTTKKDNNNPPSDNNNPTTPPVQCISVRVYDAAGTTALTSTDLAGLHVGDSITLGYVPSGNATKVQFKVNSGTHDTTTKVGSEFRFVYTLEDTTGFTITAQWFDGTAWH